jgi:ribosomal-protein-alanine N-acetyltransferase
MEKRESRAMKIIEINNADNLSQEISELAKAWTATAEFWSLDSCQNTMRASPKFFSAVAKDRGQSIGWYLAIVNGDDCELLFIYSHQNSRGQGVGKALLSDLVSRVKSSDAISAIVLEVRQSNIRAIDLYERAGFSKIMVRPHYYSNGENAFVYKLNIENP